MQITANWIELYLNYRQDILYERQVAAIASSIYPTMWGTDHNYNISCHGTPHTTARQWTILALRAYARLGQPL